MQHCYTILLMVRSITLMAPSWFMKQLLSCPLQAARWAFILLYTLSFSGSYLNTLPMVPPLADVTANPKFISAVVPTTASTECFPMFFFILLVAFICQVWGAFSLTIIRSLHKTGGMAFSNEGESEQAHT